MKILIDILHPAHVHFFRYPIDIWQQAGHELFIASRHKEIATDLLDSLGLKHQELSRLNGSGLAARGRELVQRNLALGRIIRSFRPDVMAAISGTSIAQMGRLTSTPSVVFYDTENATLANAITYPFASLVVVPRCYQAWLPKAHVRYPGYHELAYLHPERFTPDRQIALNNGLDSERPTFLLRIVSWQANHDQFETGWSQKTLTELTHWLDTFGKPVISSEVPLSQELQKYAYRGDPAQIHHLMAFCRLFIGESATMASECAVLGTPAIYAASTGRGYTDELETLYGLVKNLRTFDYDQLKQAAQDMMDQKQEHWRAAHGNMLKDVFDVSSFTASLVLRVARGETFTSDQFLNANQTGLNS